MKKILLVFLLSSCASWKQKDFEKEFSDPSENGPVVRVTSQQDEKLLEKFEVKKVEEKTSDKEEKQKKNSPAPTKTIVKKVIKKSPSQPIKKVSKVMKDPRILEGTVKPLPSDYPEELKVVNERAKRVWDLYRPNHYVDEKIFLDIHYLGMTVGKIMVTNKGKKKVNDQEVWHFNARFKSAPFYSSIYELDDTVDTFVTADRFLTTRYSLIQRETKQDVDDLQLHDRDQYKTFWFYHRKKSNGEIKDKKEEKYIPYFSIDPFSVLFFYQGLPLQDSDVYDIPIINKGKILLLKSLVEGREVIKTEKGKKKAIRVHATTKYTGETLKSGDMYLWFSDDGKRSLLKAKAKIKIGSVTAEIVDN